LSTPVMNVAGIFPALQQTEAIHVLDRNCKWYVSS
jgi:hypothetical protein